MEILDGDLGAGCGPSFLRDSLDPQTHQALTTIPLQLRLNHSATQFPSSFCFSFASCGELSLESALSDVVSNDYCSASQCQCQCIYQKRTNATRRMNSHRISIHLSSQEFRVIGCTNLKMNTRQSSHWV